jgi:hypothetical protein
MSKIKLTWLERRILEDEGVVIIDAPFKVDKKTSEIAWPSKIAVIKKWRTLMYADGITG